MTVYVDDVRHVFGRYIMCHLWADTLDELLNMVDAIGVQRKWIQGHPTLSFGKHKKASWVHFDISLTKKSLAIEHGAILTDKYAPVMPTTYLNLHEAVETNDSERMKVCLEYLARIERLRAR